MRELALLPTVRLLARSQWHETEPVGGPSDQRPFLHGALLLETSLEPESLLERMLEVEIRLGRQRTVRWGPRSVDLDLLLLDQCVRQSPKLQLPHPRMPVRPFVLMPAAEIAGWMVHPTRGQTVARMLQAVKS